MPLDRFDDLAMPTLPTLVVDADDRQDRGDQQENMKDQAKDHARYHEDEIEQSRHGLTVQKQAEWRQKGCDKVDHRVVLTMGRRRELRGPLCPVM
jgi:hypothetical protein